MRAQKSSVTCSGSVYDSSQRDQIIVKGIETPKSKTVIYGATVVGIKYRD